MEHENDGPDFSYAFGSAAWNPALRPNDEFTSTLMPVERQSHHQQIPEEAPRSQSDFDDLPTARTYTANTDIVTLDWTQSSAETVPPSDDDFFDRYGAQEEEATPSPGLDDEVTFKTVEVESLSALDFNPQPTERIHDEAASQAQPGSIADTGAHVLAPLEADIDFDRVQLPAEEQYEFQSNHTFLEEAQREDSLLPLLQDVGSTAAGIESGDASFFENQTSSPTQDAPEHIFAMATTSKTVDPAAYPTEEPNVQDTVPQSISERTEPDISWGGQGTDDFDLGGNGAAPEEPQVDDEVDFSAGPAPGLDDAWGAAFEDDDFLPEGEAANVFGFGDDDEGFLDELQDDPVISQPAPVDNATAVHAPEAVPPTASRYAPAAAVAAAAATTSAMVNRSASQYLPQATPFQDLSQTRQPISSARGPAPSPYQAAFSQPPQRPVMPNSAQSFADKARTGYASPYDLPDEISAKPRRRAPQLNSALPGAPPVQPPPRSSSYVQTPTTTAAHITPSVSSIQAPSVTSRPNVTGRVATAPSIPGQPTNSVERKSSIEFFAELPVAPPKPRAQTPAGRYGPQTPALPQPGQIAATQLPRTPSAQPIAPPMANMGLSAPARTMPYAEEHAMNSTQQPPQQISQQIMPPSNSRYSPAITKPSLPSHPQPSFTQPPQTVAPPPSRYSPAPAGPVSAQQPALQAHQSAPPPPIRSATQPYAPRTSSPLAYSSTPQNAQINQVQSSQVQPPLNFQGQTDAPQTSQAAGIVGFDATEAYNTSAQYGAQQQVTSTYTAASQEVTPPGSATSDSSVKRSSYLPSAQTPLRASTDYSGTPPPRSNAPSSISTVKQFAKTATVPISRVVPAYIPDAPIQHQYQQQQQQQQQQQSPKTIDPRAHNVQAPPARVSIAPGAEYIAPQDQRAADPLERWKGAPIFHWGNGGVVITSFPTHTPRYGMGSMGPMIKSTQDEIKTRNIKDVMPTADTLLKFPGPLKKGKKKDVLTWLRFHTAFLEQKVASSGMLGDYQAVDVRTQEKLALWKLMTVFIENDGLLEGNPTVHSAVQEIIAVPKSVDSVDVSDETMNTGASQGLSEAFDPKVLRSIQALLTDGNREKAVWQAVDQRLWAHGLLIASTMSKDVWKQVVQEFVRKEIRKAGDGTEPLAALYQVFAGNWEESIDELVSVSARAGFQMVSTEGAAPKDSLAGLQQWRETLLLVLNNRSNGDVQALLSLGRLLRNYGRIEAAHICALFALSVAQVAGDDNAQADITLLGELPNSNGSDFNTDLESILLTEVLEFGLTLSNPSAPPVPHLQAYKLYHAEVLAECGQKSEAQSYVDAVSSSIHAKTSRSPYYNVFLMQRLDDLTKRLSQSSINNSSSWKPSMDKVSSSFLSKFNSFVAGGDENKDANQPNGTPPPSEGDNFIRMKGDTPDLSRQTSNTDLYSAMNGTLPMAPPVTTSNSKYAPVSNYSPRSSLDQQRSSPYQPRASMESTRSHYEPGVPSSLARTASPPQRAGNYTPSYTPQSHYAPLDQNVMAGSQPSQNLSSNITPAAIPSYGSYIPTPPLSNDTSQHATSNESPAHRTMNGGLQQTPISGSIPASQPLGESAAKPQFSTFDAPSFQSYNAPAQDLSHQEDIASGYEPPSYQPYQPEPYQPEPYQEEPETESTSVEDKKPKKKSFMDDDDDDDMIQRAAALKKSQKSEADRIADEAFRKAAEADAAKGAPGAGADKRGSWFGGWFKGGNKDLPAAHGPGPIKAKLGEENSFVYDPELKKWINKKPGAAAATPAAGATPPPPKSVAPRSVSAAAAPPRPMSSMGPPPVPASANGGPPPPGSRPMSVPPPMIRSDSQASAAAGAGPGAAPSPGPPSGPPSRPPTSMSGASDLDDLLAGPITGRRAASGGAKRKGRYLDPMAAKS